MPSGIYKHKLLSEEHKRNISKSLMREKNHNFGKHFSEKRKEEMREISIRLGFKPPSRKGIPHTEESRRKMSNAHMGEKCSWWKGGRMMNYPESEKIRKSSEYILWRKSIYKRDDFICQKCGKSGGKLNAHHIFNFADYPELRLAIDNGITLCKKCHLKFHKKYSKKNNTKEQLEEFLNIR